MDAIYFVVVHSSFITFTNVYEGNFWKNVDNRRQFFIDFARQHNFDPLHAKNWYSISTDVIRAQKTAGSVLHYYNGNARDALGELFPNIGLDKTKFDTLPRNYWSDLENRKKVLLEFAAQEKFNPLNPENWSAFPRRKYDLFPAPGPCWCTIKEA